MILFNIRHNYRIIRFEKKNKRNIKILKYIEKIKENIENEHIKKKLYIS